MEPSPEDPETPNVLQLKKVIAEGLGQPPTTPDSCPRCTLIPGHVHATDEQDESLPSGWEGLRHLFLLLEEGNPKGSDWTDTRLYGCPECGQLYLYRMDFDGEPGQPWRHTRFLEKITFRKLRKMTERP